MHKWKILLILIFLSLFLISSCVPVQPESDPIVNTSAITEIQVSITPTTIPEATPTVTPIPKIAENFENCERLPKFENVGYYDHYGYNVQGGTIISRHVTHDDSSWKINKMGVTVEITNPKVIDGLVYFSINGSKITMTEGAILYIRLYKDPPNYDTAYQLMYSPTTNSFIQYSSTVDIDQLNQGLIHVSPYPSIIIEVYPDSTVSLTNIGGITRSYQGNYCVEQDNGFTHIANSKALYDEQCIIYTLPNGDEYGYGVDKYGNISCMQLWIEEEME